MTDVEQRVREKRNKSGSTVGGGAEDDLKNGIVKHSTHIVSHPSHPLFSRPSNNAFAHTFADVFSTLSSARASS